MQVKLLPETVLTQGPEIKSVLVLFLRTKIPHRKAFEVVTV